MVPLENVLKISLQDVLKTSSKRLEDALKTSWRCFKDVLKTSWRHMAKTNILVLTKTSSRRLEDVFWRRKAKASIFVLIKTSWRRLQDIFWRRRRKTPSRRLHQDECLLGCDSLSSFRQRRGRSPMPFFEKSKVPWFCKKKCPAGVHLCVKISFKVQF